MTHSKNFAEACDLIKIIHEEFLKGQDELERAEKARDCLDFIPMTDAEEEALRIYSAKLYDDSNAQPDVTDTVERYPQYTIK